MTSKITVTEEEYKEAEMMSNSKPFNARKLLRNISIGIIVLLCFVVSAFAYMGMEKFVLAEAFSLYVFFALVKFTTDIFGFKDLWE